MTKILFNDQILDSSKEHELFPKEYKTLYVELIGKWHDDSPLHQVFTCATEVHINYQLSYGEDFNDETPRVAVESDIFSTGTTYDLAQLSQIIIKEVPFGFFDVL